MLNSAYAEIIDRHLLNGGSVTLLSTGQVLKQLGITRQTLYKWIMLKKIKAISHEIGKRVFLEFDPREIKKISRKMTKTRRRGYSLIVDDDI